MANSNYVYFGSSSFGALILEDLLTTWGAPSLVVSIEAKPSGRKQELVKSAVSLLAIKNKLPLLEIANFKDSTVLETIKQTGCSLAILASFGKIIPASVIDFFPGGIINVHPSLLPLYRGPSPIQASLAAGDIETGVTIMKLDQVMDHGPILDQEKVAIEPTETYETLKIRLAEIGAARLIKSLPDYLAGRLQPTEQNHPAATYCPIITRSMGEINWNEPAQKIYNLYRAYTPWPGVYTFWQGQRLKLVKVSLGNNTGAPGQINLNGPKLEIYTGFGSIVIEGLQKEGGKILSTKDFIAGHQSFLQSCLPS